MDSLELELWSNVVSVPKRQRRTATRPFVFTMGFLAGTATTALASYILFG